MFRIKPEENPGFRSLGYIYVYKYIYIYMYVENVDICISLMCIFRVKGQNVPYRSWDPFTSKVHHVNRYPPHAAPKPGRVSDGLTEAEGGSGGWTSFAKVTMMAIIG